MIINNGSRHSLQWSSGELLGSSRVAIMLASIVCGVSSTGQEPPKHCIEIGILEERYMPEVATEDDSNKPYHLGVRPVFYWESGKWESFERKFNAPSFELSAEARQEFVVRRRWYLQFDKTANAIESEGELSPFMNARSAVQKIVVGIESIPSVSRTHDFSGWYDIPVRPPIPLSTLNRYQESSDLPNWEILEECDLPSHVVSSAYRDVLRQRESWYVDSQVPIVSNQEDSEIRSYLRIASKTSIEAEGVNLYRFDRVSEYEVYGDPLVCEDQNSRETWTLGSGLTLFSVGDFNDDGDLEYLFWLDRHNESGYLLATENLRKTVVYTWHYH